MDVLIQRQLQDKKNTRSIINGGDEIVRRKYDLNCRACGLDGRAMGRGQ